MKSISIPALLALAVVFGGCGQDTNTALAPAGGSQPSSADQQTLEQNVAETPEVYEDTAYELPGEEEIPYSASGAGGALGVEQEIDPARPPLPRWFRALKERQRTVTVHIEEEAEFYAAHVRITDRLWGVLNIFFPVPDPDPATADLRDFELVQKRFHDVAHRRALYLKRKAADDSTDAERAESEALAAHRGDWHLAAISNRRASSPEHTANILMITLQTESGATFEISDPLELMRFPRGIPGVKPGEGIRVLAKVEDETDLVFLFTRWGRQVMVPVAADAGAAAEAGLFVGRLRAPEDLRSFHLGVNALDRETLLTKDGPYDSDFWGLLLRTVRPEMALAQ